MEVLKKWVACMTAAVCGSLALILAGGMGGSSWVVSSVESIAIERQSLMIFDGTGEPKAGPGTALLGGAKLMLLSNQTASQMLSAVLRTSEGELIVVDGGTEGDAAHLTEVIQENGGRVSAWLITHPHSDHVGALTQMLSDPNLQIQIDAVYYSFESTEWYQTREAYRADMTEKLADKLGTLQNEVLHGDITKGQEIRVGDVIITVLNNPYLFENNAINNSSVAYQITVNGKNIVFLGDMGVEAGNALMAEYQDTGIPCDIVQMAHHGQNGVSREFYEFLHPSICLWPTPDWLWENDIGTGSGRGPWSTWETRQWMWDLGVRVNYCICYGDQVIQ